jgi:hypothetical protein
LKIWWARKPKPGNFGDVLTPSVLDYFGIKYQYSKDEYNALCIGSIARMARPGITVLGSGVLSIQEELNPHADWRFVRGPITRNSLLQSGGYCPPVYGDPALLLPLFCSESRKRFDVGIVPHYSDYQFVKIMYPDQHIINVLNQDPVSVARAITECRSIVSSSLHGIICAHAYGIPAAWVKFGTRFNSDIKGNDVKFYDHYLALGLTANVSTWDDLHFTNAEIDTARLIALSEIFRDVSYEQKQGYQHELDFSQQRA